MFSWSLHSRSRALMYALFASSLLSGTAYGQNSAPSSHMVFDDAFAGDIVINQVRVPKDGEAMYTYYEALGWRGKGAGYAGIQAHPRAHNFIFSIWDHKEHTAPIRAVYRGPGTETQKFGGEGTGLKSWNFKLGWKTGVWYTLVARNWPVGDHTYFAFWSQAGDTKKWTHLVTMDVAAKQAAFEGRTDAFIEDWLSTGRHARTTHLRGGWKRKLNGDWFAFQKARYSVNSWDLKEGKRSFNYRRQWDGGVKSTKKDGSYYYMVAGGKETKPHAKNPSVHSIERTEKQPRFPRIKIDKCSATIKARRIVTSWKLDATTSPLFAYSLEVYDNKKLKGEPLIRMMERKPHAEGAQLSLGEIENLPEQLWLKVEMTDIFDRRSLPQFVKMETP